MWRKFHLKLQHVIFFLQNDDIFYHNDIMMFMLKLPISSKHMDVSIDFFLNHV
jgi:hypothetical protein